MSDRDQPPLLETLGTHRTRVIQVLGVWMVAVMVLLGFSPYGEYIFGWRMHLLGATFFVLLLAVISVTKQLQTASSGRTQPSSPDTEQLDKDDLIEILEQDTTNYPPIGTRQDAYRNRRPDPDPELRRSDSRRSESVSELGWAELDDELAQYDEIEDHRDESPREHG